MSALAVRLATALACASPAIAGSTTHTFTTPLSPMPLNNVVVNVPQFDPSAGHLKSVLVIIRIYLQASWNVENLDSQPTPSVGAYCGQASQSYWPGVGGLQASDGSPYGLSPFGYWDVVHCVPLLAAFDGTVDYQGPSGVVSSLPPMSGSGLANHPSVTSGFPPIGVSQPVVLDWYTGTGNRQIQFSATAHYFSDYVSPTLNVQFVPSGYGVVTVKYEYAAFPADICLHDGFASNPCPCDTVGASGFGCPHSQNSAGARLQASGTSSLSNDTFVLQATGLPSQAIGLFFQGTAYTYQSQSFGDGLRCVTGTVHRLGIKTASLGTSSYPGPGDPPISVKGQVTVPGSPRAYQVWFRDPAPFCTPATFNLTSGIATIWSP